MRKLLPIILLVVLLAVGWWLFAPSPEQPEITPGAKQLKVHFIDVGQGDCTLIETPDGRNLLVDAGDSDSGPVVVDYLRRLGISRLDLLVISHPHEDHIGGLSEVLGSLGVSRVAGGDWKVGSPIYEKVLSSIEERRIDYRQIGRDLAPIASKDVQVQFIRPGGGSSGDGESEVNDGSIVVLVRYKGIGVLLTGDIQLGAEAQLLNGQRDLRATILKVAHHGSDDSTSNELLQVVKPAYAVISVGRDNPYGHPSRAIVRRLAAAGAKVYRTDQDGSIVFATDGERVSVESEQ